MRITLHTCIGLTLLFSVADGQIKENCWEPRPRTQNHPWMSMAEWNGMHESFLRYAQRGNVDLLFLGDSITQDWANAPEVWQEQFGDRRPANFGIAGDTTQNVLWRITAGGELAGLSPKVVVLLVGTNNYGFNDDSAAEVAHGVKAIVETLHEKLSTSKILLLGILPRDALPDTDFRRRIAQTNQLLRQLADGKAVRYLDMGDRFLDADGNIPADLLPDFLHLSKQGYRLWAQAMKPELDALWQQE
ncbi:MAG: GDSL-type esterase/lipase family protein [Steroidobacteraceae bacterium]